MEEVSMGVAWGFLYGYPTTKYDGPADVPAAVFMPQLRQLGASHTKIYLFWNQIEPEQGQFDWDAVDTFLDQMGSPEEAIISLFSASVWATRLSRPVLPPSPAKNPEDYYRFIHTLVSRCKGRVRYWQNDSEPNNPIFWAGTPEEFIAQLAVFYRAVKDADPEAVVLCGGYDGLFHPPGPGVRPYPGQEYGLAFFDRVFQEAGQFFDVFDVRLYADPSTIPARVEYLRQKMSERGCPKPIVCTEYHGPGFFEFYVNFQYVEAIMAWSSSITAEEHSDGVAKQAAMRDAMQALYAKRDTLAPQTQMFLEDSSPELQAKLARLQCRDLVMRNVLALSAGIKKTLYWDLCHENNDPYDVMTLMFGKHKLMEMENGAPTHRFPVADAFQRMTEHLAGVERVERISLPATPSIYLFEAQRRNRGSVFILWERRDIFSGEDLPPVPVTLPAGLSGSQAVDVFGQAVPVRSDQGGLTLAITDTPVFVLPVA